MTEDLIELKEMFLDGKIGLGVWETIYMTLLATLIAYLIGLPLGILLYFTKKDGIKPIGWLNKILGFVVNIFRSLPFIILLVLIIPFAKLIVGRSYGNGVMIVALVITATPYIARTVDVSLSEINKGVIEAVQSMGISTLGLIFKVLIPEAIPTLLSNAIITTITILGYSAMADTVAGGGLGKLAVIDGRAFGNEFVIWVCVILTIVIVQLIQEIGTRIVLKIDKRKR